MHAYIDIFQDINLRALIITIIFKNIFSKYKYFYILLNNSLIFFKYFKLKQTLKRMLKSLEINNYIGI